MKKWLLGLLATLGLLGLMIWVISRFGWLTSLTWAGNLLLWSVAMIIAIYYLAKVDIFFTFVPEGEIKFIVKGETLHRILTNIRGCNLDANNNIVKDKSGTLNNNGMNLLTRWFGIYGPFWYPLYKVYWYKFAWDEMAQETGSAEAIQNTEWRPYRRQEQVPSLFFQFVYPVVATNVELGDQLRINIRGTVTAQVECPYTPIFLLKGDWFPPFSAAIEGALSDYARNLTYAEFIAAEKGGDSAPISKAVRSRLVTAGLRKSVGVIPVAFNYHSFELVDGPQAAIRKATEAAALAEAEGKAAVAKAAAEARALEIESEAKAAAITALGAAQAKAWELQRQAAGGETNLLIAREKRDAAGEIGKGFGGNTLVVGGSATPLINTDGTKSS